MIDFYFAPTPNGWKVAIMLEECGLPYRTHLMKLSEGDQFKPDYLAISPNAKMPAIVDNDAAGGMGGEAMSVFESGAILFYLAEKTGRFMPESPLGRKEALEWLFWQVGNQGPMAGQLSHFKNYAPEGEDYGFKRYLGEYERNLAVLERRLSDRDYILGDYSIADMILYPWMVILEDFADIPLSDYPHLEAWTGRIGARDAVKRAETA